MEVPLPPLGTSALSIVVSGSVLSTSQVNSAGVGSTLPTASTAETLNVCEPSARPIMSNGEVQGSVIVPSTSQIKWSPPTLSVPENSNLIEVSAVSSPSLMEVPLPPLGTSALSIVVSGSVLSTSQVNSAGVGSTLPTASTAETLNVCEPSARPIMSNGEVQGSVIVPSTSQIKWSTPTLSVPENSNLIEVSAVSSPSLMEVPLPPLGTSALSIVVSGSGSE